MVELRGQGDDALDRLGGAVAGTLAREVKSNYSLKNQPARRIRNSLADRRRLWHIRNVAVAQRTLSGISLTPLGDFLFLKNVARVRAASTN